MAGARTARPAAAGPSPHRHQHPARPTPPPSSFPRSGNPGQGCGVGRMPGVRDHPSLQPGPTAPRPPLRWRTLGIFRPRIFPRTPGPHREARYPTPFALSLSKGRCSAPALARPPHRAIRELPVPPPHALTPPPRANADAPVTIHSWNISSPPPSRHGTPRPHGPHRWPHAVRLPTAGNCFNTAERSCICFVAAMRHISYKANANTVSPQLRGAEKHSLPQIRGGPQTVRPSRSPAPPTAPRREGRRRFRWGRQAWHRGQCGWGSQQAARPGPVLRLSSALSKAASLPAVAGERILEPLHYAAHHPRGDRSVPRGMGNRHRP